MNRVAALCREEHNKDTAERDINVGKIVFLKMMKLFWCLNTCLNTFKACSEH